MATPQKNRDVSGYTDSPKGAAPIGKSCFLGIGIDAYQHFSKLHNAVRDMEAVRNLLMTEYDLEEENCRTITNEQATRKGILRALRELPDWVQKDDKLIIYYSGHGHVDKFKDGFWVPVEVSRGEEEDYVSNTELRGLLGKLPFRHILLISDSCFSGALFVRGADRADAASDELELRASRWALCSGRHNELVADGKPGEHSPFAASILTELRHSSQQALRIGTLAERVIELTRANYEQLPEGAPLQGVGHLGGQYVFRRKIDEAALLKQNAQRAWLAIQAMPDENLKEIHAKRQRVSAFCDEYPDTEPYDDALRMGRDLEHKEEFLRNWNSEFGLRDFIRKDTPYLDAAKKRLKELSTSEPQLQSQPQPQSQPPKPTPQPTPSPKPKAASLPPEARWAAMGVSALVVVVLMVVMLFNRCGGTSEPELPDYTQLDQPMVDAMQQRNRKQVENLRNELSLLPDWPEKEAKLKDIDRWIMAYADSLRTDSLERAKPSGVETPPASTTANPADTRPTQTTTTSPPIQNASQVEQQNDKIIKSIADNMVRIKGGTFTMGCKEGRDKGCQDSEKPTREVRVSDFIISKYEVTQAQWRAVMGSDPSRLQNKGCDDCPVEGVSWNEVQEFIQELNEQTGRRYRLPTEAEWEYAARGGNNKSMDYSYSGSRSLDEVAWYDRNATITRPVGKKKPNTLGLYDMSGNVKEWCEDTYKSYSPSGGISPMTPITSSPVTGKVVRGGSWNSPASDCRVANRSQLLRTLFAKDIGFRLAL